MDRVVFTEKGSGLSLGGSRLENAVQLQRKGSNLALLVTREPLAQTKLSKHGHRYQHRSAEQPDGPLEGHSLRLLRRLRVLLPDLVLPVLHVRKECRGHHWNRVLRALRHLLVPANVGPIRHPMRPLLQQADHQAGVQPPSPGKDCAARRKTTAT